LADFNKTPEGAKAILTLRPKPEPE
jgi:hypothetical protein